MREFDGQAGAVILHDATFNVETTANGLDAFAHAAQAVALADNLVLPVVFYHEPAMTGFGDKTEPAIGGAGVADDVCYGLAQRESEGRFFLRTEGLAVWFAFRLQLDAGSIKGTASGVDFGGQAAGAVAANGFADFSEGVAGGSFNVRHFRGGADGIEQDEAAGEFGLEDNDGERMAEDIMQVTGDAFALGHGGEGDVLFKHGAELTFGAPLLGEVDVAMRLGSISGWMKRKPV
jgi:hypothetical protein